MSRMVKVVSPGWMPNSWYWEVVSADDGHIVDHGVVDGREAAIAEANRVKAAALNAGAIPARLLSV